MVILTLKKCVQHEKKNNGLTKALIVEKKLKIDSIMFTLDHQSQLLMFLRTKRSSNV